MPPSPFAILTSINWTFDAFTAISAAFIIVKADIVSIAPIDFKSFISVAPAIATRTCGDTLFIIWLSTKNTSAIDFPLS